MNSYNFHLFFVCVSRRCSRRDESYTTHVIDGNCYSFDSRYSDTKFQLRQETVIGKYPVTFFFNLKVYVTTVQTEMINPAHSLEIINKIRSFR